MTDHPKQQPKRTGKCEGKNAGIYDPENVICSKLCPDRFVCVAETKNPIVGGRTKEPERDCNNCVDDCTECDKDTRGHPLPACPDWKKIEHSDGGEWCCMRSVPERDAPSVINCLKSLDSDTGLLIDFCRVCGKRSLCDCDVVFKHDALIASAIAEDRKRPRAPCEECVYQNAANEIQIDDFCICDITMYIQNTQAAEDVSRCRGESCNYCGRFGTQNEPKEQKV